MFLYVWKLQCFELNSIHANVGGKIHINVAEAKLGCEGGGGGEGGRRSMSRIFHAPKQSLSLINR